MPSKLTYCQFPHKLRMKLVFMTLLLTFGMGQSIAQHGTKDSLVQKIKDFRSSNGQHSADTLYIAMLNKLASELRYYNTDSLLLLSEQALKHSEEAEFVNGECRALLGMGNYYSDKGDHLQGITFYQNALDKAISINNKELILRTKNNLSGEYGYKGDYAKALSGYLDGVELAQEYGDLLMQSIINENIANLYASQKDYKQALDFYKIVKKINDQIGNEVYSAETMSNMASVYAEMGELEYAMFNVNSSISIFEKNEILDWLAFAYEIKGKTYLEDHKFKWALYWYQQSELLHKNLEDDRGKIDLYNGFAEAYLGLQKDSLSQQYALNAFEISSQLKFKEGTKKCAKTLFKIHKNKKDFDKALEYHEIYQQLSDTLSRNENKKSLTMLKTKIAVTVAVSGAPYNNGQSCNWK